jgi:uncharacterized integral membrane protein
MRYVYGFVTLLLGAVCAVFAVSNRTLVDVSLWPFPGSERLPLYALSLGTAAAGLALGLIMGWLMAIPARLARRRLAQQLAQAEAELKRLRGQVAAQTAAAVPTAAPVKVDA